MSGLTSWRLSGARTKQRGAAPAVNEDLLAYTEFTQLQQIILDDWNKFGPALGKRKYISVYFDRLNGFRNPTMHSRPLREFERDLVKGIVGELRNLIVMYRSAQGPDMAYYPKIELVADSFGNNQNDALDFSPKAHLEVGQCVNFECRGWDPQDRNLIWQLMIDRGWDGNVVAEAQGSEVTLTLVINEEMVRERLLVEISMRSEGQYHRNGFFDDLVNFYYAVDPPRE